MSSMLIGKHVTRHREWPEPKYVPLAECFQQAGYATIGVSANVLLATDHHFDRGYDHYDASFGPKDNDGKPFDMLYDAIMPPVERALEGNADASREVVVGIRPEAFEDARLVTDTSRGVTFTQHVDILESIGSAKFAYMNVEAPSTSTKLTELAAESGADELFGSSQMVAQLDAKSPVKESDDLELWLNPDDIDLFEPEHGDNLLK